MSRVNIPIKKCEPGVLRVRTAKFEEVEDANVLILQAFVLMYLSWFSKLIMIDGGIIDDTVKEFKDINTMLIEKNNYFIVVGYISNYNN